MSQDVCVVNIFKISISYAGALILDSAYIGIIIFVIISNNVL